MAGKDKAAMAPPAPPPWYEATADLMISGEDGGMPQPAFRAGDTHVPPDLVERWGWQDSVRVPEQFAGALPATAPEGNVGESGGQDESSGAGEADSAAPLPVDGENGAAEAAPETDKAADAAEEKG